MVLTNDDSLAHRLRISRVHGAQPKYYHKFIGGNFRIDAIQAAVLNVKLNYLDDWTGSRSKNADTYRELFLRCGLDSMKGFLLPQSVYASSDASFAHIYNQFVLRTPKRDELRSHLSARGISSEIYYPLPFHLQECFAHLGYRKGDFPQAEIASNSVLALPIYPELGRKELSYIVEKIAEFYKG
jgi:dTDP-4-amino-4,6-dideoxygalactose transaminase